MTRNGQAGARARPSRTRQGRAGSGPDIQKTTLPPRLSTVMGCTWRTAPANISPPVNATPSRARRNMPTHRRSPFAWRSLMPAVRALALSADGVDLAAGVLVIESLKKRRALSPSPLDAFSTWHKVSTNGEARRAKNRDERLWDWARMSAVE